MGSFGLKLGFCANSLRPSTMHNTYLKLLCYIVQHILSRSTPYFVAFLTFYCVLEQYLLGIDEFVSGSRPSAMWTSLQKKFVIIVVICFYHSNALERRSRMQSYNFPSFNFGFSDSGGVVITTTPETFRIVSPGLMRVPGTVSFESVRYPGRYLRHRSLVLHLDTFSEGNLLLFKKDATFYPRQGRFFPGYTAYESYNFPGYFIRHQNYILKISQRQNPTSDLYKKDASFAEIEDLSSIVKTAPTNFISSNFPQHSIGFTNANLLAIVENNVEKFRVVSPGLNGQLGTVSLESDRHPGRYLRHRNFMIHLDQFAERSVFFDDASFRLEEGRFLPGYVSFESYNYPNRYIRHQGYRLKLHANDGSALFKSDASFLRSIGATTFRREGPYRFRSKNFGDYLIGVDNSGIPKIINSGDDVFYVVSPGLTGEEGTISLASDAFPGHYLRHRNLLLHLDPFEESIVYKPDATFRPRLNLFYQGYVALEASNFKDYFIRHQNYRLKISKNDGSELFRLDSSFMMEY